jgi:hypothetical protein
MAMSNGYRRMARDFGAYIERPQRERSRTMEAMMGTAAAGLREMLGRVTVRLVALGRALVERGVRAHRRRTGLRELEALDDRMVKRAMKSALPQPGALTTPHIALFMSGSAAA